MQTILRSAWATMGVLVLMAVLVLGAALPHAQDVAPEPLPLPHVLLVRADGLIQLSGTVPDEAERDALEQHVRSRYTGLPMHSHLQVGVVGNPSWLNAAYLPDLRGTHRASVRLADAEVRLEAEVPSDFLRRQLLASSAAARNAGLRVVERVELR